MENLPEWMREIFNKATWPPIGSSTLRLEAKTGWTTHIEMYEWIVQWKMKGSLQLEYFTDEQFKDFCEPVSEPPAKTD